MHWYDREPRVVLKDTLAWDPVIDVLLRRIPARFITPQPGKGAGDGARAADRGAGRRPRPRRRLRDLPRGRQLHQRPAAAGDRPAAPAGDGADGGAGRGDEPRARAPAGRLHRGAGRGARRGRRPGRPHRARPHAQRGRHLARAADGQADRDAVVAGAAGRDPDRPRGADRVALRLVGPHRRLDRAAPARGAAPDQHRPTGRPSRAGRSGGIACRAGRSGAATACRPRGRRPRRARRAS